MKVGIDARFITRYPRRGIGNYSLNLVSELVRLDSNVEYVLYIAEADVEGILPSLPNVTIRQLWPRLYPIWENVSLPIAVLKDRLDVLHCLGNTAPLFIPHRVQLVLTLMDVMFLQPHNIVPKPTTPYQWLGRFYRAFSAPFAARSSNRVIAMSEFARQDILRVISSVEPSRVSVTHMSCDPVFCFETIEIENGIVDTLCDRYILCLGAEDPRKNILRLVKVYLNNILISTTSTTGAQPSSSNSGIRLMRRWDFAENWGGYLSTVGIYDKSLTQSQISSIWNTTKSRYGL